MLGSIISNFLVEYVISLVILPIATAIEGIYWFPVGYSSTVHVPSDTLRTWKWSPTRSDTLRTWKWSPTRGGEILSSMNSPNKQRKRKWEKTQKPKIRPVCYHVFNNFTKSRIWSYGRYAPSGIRVQPKTRKRDMFAKKCISLKNRSLNKTKCDFSQKFRYGLNMLILVRYDIIRNN